MATCRVQDPLHVRLRKSCWIFWAREGGEIVSKVFFKVFNYHRDARSSLGQHVLERCERRENGMEFDAVQLIYRPVTRTKTIKARLFCRVFLFYALGGKKELWYYRS